MHVPYIFYIVKIILQTIYQTIELPVQSVNVKLQSKNPSCVAQLDISYTYHHTDFFLHFLLYVDLVLVLVWHYTTLAWLHGFGNVEFLSFLGNVMRAEFHLQNGME